MADSTVADEVIDISEKPAETKAIARAHKRMPPVETRWKPGQSGNPSGKSKEAELVRSAARKHGVEAINKLVDLMRNGPPKVQVMAAMTLLDRGFGKAQQTIGDEDGRALGGVIFLPIPDGER